MSDDRLDMRQTLALLEEVRELVERLDNSPLNIEGSNNKEVMRRKAQASRQLLYAAHVADLTRAEILSQYHKFKGETPPLIVS